MRLEQFKRRLTVLRKRAAVRFRWFGRRLKRRRQRLSETFIRRRALSWQRLYKARNRYLIWRSRRGAIAALVALALLVAVSAYWIPALQAFLAPHFGSEAQISLLASLFLTLGGALVGAAAIVSSLVLFAMQVNIERMPHGLFRRLSADRWLLGAFGASFLLAAGVASLSLMTDRQSLGMTAFLAFWAIMFVFALFVFSYRRALRLVNPLYQLGMVVRDTRRELRIWERRAKRAAPLIPTGADGQDRRGHPDAPQHDLTRTVYFQANPRWSDGAIQGVRYAVSFARRYAEHGDHEVGGEAMNAIIAINRGYVAAKGKTFFAHAPLLDNPLTSDGFITDTLEQLRQNARVGVTRGDEEQIEQTLRAMAGLVGVYATIDYASPHASKTHAHLAATYLTGEVERIVAHRMPDVLMDGVRLMGRCADILLSAEGPQGIRTLTEKIGLISCAGAAREEYRPVTSTGVEQLARLTFELLRTRSADIGFAAEDIRSSIKIVAKMLLTLPDTPITNIHSFYLAPYYSATQGLTGRLEQLVNAIAQAPAGDSDAQRVIDNIEQWADGIFRTEKELLLEAVAKRSQLTFDLIHWITTVTKVLLAVSNAAACDEHTQGELRNHAVWLISVLSFIPDDEETARFIEHFRMTETLFESAVDARDRGCAEIATDIAKLLLSWMFKAGRYHTGWATLERCVYGVATLALLGEEPDSVTWLKADIAARMAAGDLPDQGVRDHAAREIRGRAATLYRRGHWSSAIEQTMAEVDHQELQALLEEIADLISPETAGQAARPGFV